MELETYLSYPERSTGTIVAVNGNPTRREASTTTCMVKIEVLRAICLLAFSVLQVTNDNVTVIPQALNAMIDSAFEIHREQHRQGILKSFIRDQPALREASFIHRCAKNL